MNKRSLLACSALGPALWLQLAIPVAAAPTANPSADDFLIVHCLLPGQLRQLGQRTTYMSARKPARLSALECRARGGEYVLKDSPSISVALRGWLKRAEQGDIEAQVTLAEIFEQGVGATPDYLSAAKWYHKAAEQGSASAQISLGTLYEKGLGVTKDSAQALRWFRLASGVPNSATLETNPDIAPVEAKQSREQNQLAEQVVQLTAANQSLSRELDAARDAQQALTVQQSERGAAQAESSALLQALSERLAVREDRLRELTSKLKLTQSQLENRELEVAKLSQQNIASEDSLVKRIEALAQREENLIAQYDEMQAARARLKIVEEQSQLRSQELAESRTSPDQKKFLAPPNITIIDPRLQQTTRGLVQVTAPPVTLTDAQQLIGRVSAPAELLSLTVAGNPVRVNSVGVFKAQLPGREAARSSLTVTAIDQQGQRSDLQIQLFQSKQASNSARSEPSWDKDIDFGSFHALLIGNNRYQKLPQLKTPKADVEQLDKILTERYGFKTTVLLDATRYQVLAALNKLRSTLTSKDNLLLYYAGHGELDETNMRGHWLPVDADPDNTANWISNVDVTDILNLMQAKQVLLVVDSCYSGTLTRSSITKLQTGQTLEERNAWLRLMATKRARVVLASGGLAPVLDSGGGNHSVFAGAFIDAVQSNTDVLTSRSLHQAVVARVAHAAAQQSFEQMPEFAPISRAGHEAGDFIFLPVPSARN